eukprot:TRINITY_DN13751_c0_g1_i1.p1 TRINITY_DN13751_c0_g1~~TRINITY_DN13751_c0_g1_i1.p1  ORF type:complete len:306 (-),score=82.92 TRINITY_DN13751_c0_g1_i1:192-1082(-)
MHAPCYLLLALVAVLCAVAAGAPPPPRPPGGGGPGGGGMDMGSLACSDNFASFSTPAATSNCNPFRMTNAYEYPDDFPFENWVEHYECEKSGVRVIRSNGVPSHDVKVANPNTMCEVPWFVTLPLWPEYTTTATEVAPLGIIAMSLDGVPQYGALEAEGLNAVEPGSSSPVQDAQFWYGHAAMTNDWHYHHPFSGNAQKPGEDDLVAFAMDGFPIYGEVADPSVLDECNGRMVDGEYRYHTVPLGFVDENQEYCDGSSPAVRWRYMLGCYHGSVAHSNVASAQTSSVPDDCRRVYF